jgi:hypothetical protein
VVNRIAIFAIRGDDELGGVEETAGEKRQQAGMLMIFPDYDFFDKFLERKESYKS